MRKVLIMLMPVAVLALIVVAIQAQQVPTKWLDPQNCYFCKPMAETPGLMEHVKWETHKIANGVVSLTTYSPEWKDKTEVALAEMHKLWVNYDPAKHYQMCGMCQAWTKLPQDKIKMETVEFNGGELSISTSTDPMVVAKLHEIADKTTAAMATMAAMPESHSGMH